MTMVPSGATWGKYLPNGGVQWLLTSKVALGMLHWAMHLALHQRIAITIEMVREAGAFCMSLIYCHA
jgi:hypothetical protein